jgi:polyisoprenoid-binding protein YceI
MWLHVQSHVLPWFHVSGMPSAYHRETTTFGEIPQMATATTPLAGTYTADPVHSSFGFAVTYQGVSVYRGTLDEVQATLADGRLEGAAKVESISIRQPEQFRAHVLSPEFFDAEGHPEVTYTSTSLELNEDGTAVAEGELTIKGITKPVRATGTWQAPAADAFGNTRGHLQLDAQVDRTAYDMNWNAPLPSGGNALANDVTLTVDISLIAAA